jgi:hypothetical protein
MIEGPRFGNHRHDNPLTASRRFSPALGSARELLSDSCLDGQWAYPLPLQILNPVF